ncbi:MAG: prepilin-type N-terminal cleavage/methylation domain-containing protein [Planctomycetes bacterium]|nr:prepilin-type N-terminal cleavage/methylation domain-containing protein [Planctomycetota bacterium]
MRKGFSLIELLIVMMTVPVVMLVVYRVFHEMAIDIPRGVALLSQHGRLLGVVETLHDDIDRATALSLEDSPQTEGAPVLLIEQPGRQVRYALLEEGIRRESGGDKLDPNVPAEREWILPQANIAWHLWRQDDAVVALRVDTSMTHGRHKKRKFQNTHLFFIGSGSSQGGRHATP